MLANQDIEARAFTIIAEIGGTTADALDAGQRFEQDLSFDSLMRIELVMQFEEAFGIAIDDAEAESIHTVGEALALAKLKLSGGLPIA